METENTETYFKLVGDAIRFEFQNNNSRYSTGNGLKGTRLTAD